MVTRRGLLVGGSVGVAVGVGLGGVVGWEMAPTSVRADVRRALGRGPEIYIPDAPEGQVRLEQVTSQYLGGATDLFTAVPAGHGAGAGLPVIVVLHGSSASAAAFREYGLARFVTAAVQAGAPPFVLAGTDDGPDGWVPSAGVDPQAMLREELPRWLEDRGFAADRRALWGWSRGGYGALRYVQVAPDWARGLALFSPGLLPGNPVLDDLSPLATMPWGLWCGESDPYHDGAVALSEQAPVAPDPWVQGPGAHTQSYWNDHTLPMMQFLARTL